MKKFTSILKSLSMGKVESSSLPTVLLLLISGAAVIVTMPLLLVWGLQLIGLPVTISLSSWLGAVLVFFFIKLASANTNNDNRSQNDKSQE
jgi:membrane protein implicated in regulation of membrane protease activity